MAHIVLYIVFLPRIVTCHIYVCLTVLNMQLLIFFSLNIENVGKHGELG